MPEGLGLRYEALPDVFFAGIGRPSRGAPTRVAELRSRYELDGVTVTLAGDFLTY